MRGPAALPEEFVGSCIALLVIDMQNAYCHRKGAVALAGTNIQSVRDAIPQVGRLVESCRRFGMPVIWTLMEQYADDARKRSRDIPAHVQSRRNTPFCVKGSWDAELIKELRPLLIERDHVIRKQEYSAFYNTNLEVLLKISGVSHLVVCGVATHICVESTIRDAFYRGLEVMLVEDATACGFPDLYQATLKNTKLWFGHTASLSQVQEELLRERTVPEHRNDVRVARKRRRDSA